MGCLSKKGGESQASRLKTITNFLTNKETKKWKQKVKQQKLKIK